MFKLRIWLSNLIAPNGYEVLTLGKLVICPTGYQVCKNPAKGQGKKNGTTE